MKKSRLKMVGTGLSLADITGAQRKQVEWPVYMLDFTDLTFVCMTNARYVG
jgi:hypothetical protein